MVFHTGFSGSVPGGDSRGAQVPKQTQEKMELNISASLSWPLIVKGVTVTWSGLGCFGSIRAFLWAGSPHPAFEMVLAG